MTLDYIDTCSKRPEKICSLLSKKHPEFSISAFYWTKNICDLSQAYWIKDLVGCTIREKRIQLYSMSQASFAHTASYHCLKEDSQKHL